MAESSSQQGAASATSDGSGAVPSALAGLEAVIFDMDGVVTDTASVHARAWKRTFDDFLGAWDASAQEFDARDDYVRYVDGKPRYDGVASFLASRGIELEWGDPDDAPDRETVCGVGNRKDRMFREELDDRGVAVFQSTRELVRALRAAGVATAVISSSRNCVPVLEAAGALDLFDVKVDGVDSAQLGLAGKPAPDIFLEAARRLDVQPSRAAVVEDALAGVEAGRRGEFALVVGVDRASQAEALAEAGADVVVDDLGRLGADDDQIDAWQVVYEGFDPEQEGLREALCTLGNGHFAARGAAPECDAGGAHYPGTYAAGVFNRLSTDIAGRTVENEDLVNLPNWLVLRFRAEDADAWFSPDSAMLDSYRQELDLRRGVLTRDLRFSDPAGRTTSVRQRRIVSMDEAHLAALETTFVAENWSGRLVVHSALDGRVANLGVERYRDLAHDHLVAEEVRSIDEDTVCLVASTSQSHIRIGEAARTCVASRGRPVDAQRRLIDNSGYVAHELSVPVEQGHPVTVEKVVALVTSRDRAVSEVGAACCRQIAHADGFDGLLRRHAASWERLWRRCELHIEGQPRAELILNLHVFHLLQTVSEHTVGLDVGVPARGLHGEAYRGHIFWDELFIFPFLNLRMPELTRSLLLYRYRRLAEARWAAQAAGHRGAMFPWQSGSDGREESQLVHLNPRSGRWNPDHSRLQWHINIAVAYNVWQYYQVTGDLEFLSFYGAELLCEIARFWASAAQRNPDTGRYDIRGVIGPDEYHDAYPDAEGPGLDNNAYTNVMAVWVLLRATDALAELPDWRRDELLTALELGADEFARWEDVTRRMTVPFHDDGVISQFEGYDRLAEFDWDGYRRRYGDIQRLDRILDAEGDTPNRYKLSKQADALMLLFLLPAEELERLLRRLGYDFDPEAIPRTVAYYLARTSHGSTLSRMVHSWILARSDRSQSWDLFLQALESDFIDIQGGTTAEGIHLGAMAGTVDLVQRCYTGIAADKQRLRLDPSLPDELKALEFVIRWRDHWGIRICITHREVEVHAPEPSTSPVRLRIGDHDLSVAPGERATLTL